MSDIILSKKLIDVLMEDGDGCIQRLPEECIAYILSFTSPRDACQAAAVSAAFCAAAASDGVWERFLPPDYQQILPRAVDPVPAASKKELFLRLCDSILIDRGKLSFALEKSSGRKCYMLSARELLIIWGDTPQYWRWISLSSSRFSEVAELLGVCWLEIQGKIDATMLSPSTTYAAFLVFKLVHGSQNLTLPAQQAFVKMGGILVSVSSLCLQPDEIEAQRHANMHRRLMTARHQGIFRTPPWRIEDMRSIPRSPHVRDDGWMEIEIGEFSIEVGDEGLVEMSLMAVKGAQWKKGLIVEGIVVRPKI